jgi:hypothetical protein
MFFVGDKVRVISDTDGNVPTFFNIGDVGIITEVRSDGAAFVVFEDGEEWVVPLQDLEVV